MSYHVSPKATPIHVIFPSFYLILLFQNLPLARLPSLVLSWKNWNHRPLTSVGYIWLQVLSQFFLNSKSVWSKKGHFLRSSKSFALNHPHFLDAKQENSVLEWLAHWLVTIGIQWWPGPFQQQDWDQCFLLLKKKKKMGTLKQQVLHITMPEIKKTNDPKW